ncbi:hypothetical protein CRYUN_Cryun22dG0009700 [Craigia yunnanensis]
MRKKHNLGRELESLLAEMPMHIIDFLREHSSNGRESREEEIEIDIDDLSDDTLFKLRKLLDDYLQEKQKNQSRAEPCEIEDEEDVDIGGNDPPLSSYPPVEIEKDTCHRSAMSVSSGSSRDSDSGSSSDSESDRAKASSLVDALKVLEAVDSEAQLDKKTECISGLDQLERTSQPKPSSVESDSHQDAALLKNRFADTILKAREKTLTQGDKGEPEKLHREREELEQQRRKEAAVEARRKRELKREAARLALLKMEKTVEIDENSRFLEDLKMLRAAPASSVDETSPDHSQDGLGSFKFGSSNPLEQLGLYMEDEEEEKVSHLVFQIR